MFLSISRRAVRRWPLVSLLASAATLLVALSTGSLASSGPPTPAQISAAVARAKSSPKLWATVNICNTRRHPDKMGVRGQMPALGFRTSMTMRIRIDYWSAAKHRYVPVPDPSTRRLVQLGHATYRSLQGGWTFSFQPGAGRLRGFVRFAWWRAGQLLGSKTVSTTGGHHDADYGDPRGYSAATCLIK